MSSVVDICNDALDRLGQNPIISLDDGNKPANVCKRMWPIARDALLRLHPFNFAVARAALAPSSTAPAWGFAYQHPLPSDCLRVIEVRDLRKSEYQVEKRNILTDESVLYIRYVFREEDPNQYDSLFVKVAAIFLAYNMCESFNQSDRKRESLMQEFNDLLPMVKMADGVENPPGETEEDEWVEVRY